MNPDTDGHLAYEQKKYFNEMEGYDNWLQRNENDLLATFIDKYGVSIPVKDWDKDAVSAWNIYCEDRFDRGEYGTE